MNHIAYSSNLRKWRIRAESGLVVTIQAIYYVLLLFAMFALVYDFGAVSYAASIAANSVRVAAQDAAKNIDEEAFINYQTIRLSNDALARAQDVVDGMSGGNVHVTSISITSLKRHEVITIQAQATVELKVLGSLIGLNQATVPVEAYAEPAYGISEEGQ